METPVSANFEYRASMRNFSSLSPNSTLEGKKFMFGDDIWQLKVYPVSKVDSDKTEICLINHEKRKKGRLRFDLYVRTTTKELYRSPYVHEFPSSASFMHEFSTGSQIHEFEPSRRSSYFDRQHILDACEKTQEVIFGCQMFKDPEYQNIYPRSVADSFANLLNDTETADVEFKLGSRTFYGHKVILAARLPYFKTLFYGGFGESVASTSARQTVEVPDDDQDAFLAMLDFLYTGTTPSRSLSAEHLLQIADKYSVSYLLDLTTEWAVVETTVCTDSTVGQFFKYGWRYPRLAEHLAALIADSYDKFGGKEEFKSHLRNLMQQEVDPTAITVLLDALSKRKRGDLLVRCRKILLEGGEGR